MFNLNDIDINNINFKQRQSLYHNLKLISNKKKSHLIRIKTINEGEFLVKEKKPVEGIYFILEGMVKVFNSGLDKNIKILRLVSKGDIIGLSSLNSNYYWSSAIVVKRARVYFISQKNLNTILQTNCKLGLLLVNSLAFKLRYYEVRQKHLSIFSAADRVIDALLLTAYKFGNTTDQGLEVSICTSRKEIASFANTTPEKVTRTLSDLKKQKNIEVNGKNIVIKAKQALINHLIKYLNQTEEPSDMNFSYPNLFY